MNEARHHQRAKINKRVFGILLSYQAVFVYFGWLLCVKSAENCILKTKGRIFFLLLPPIKLNKIGSLVERKEESRQNSSKFPPIKIYGGKRSTGQFHLRFLIFVAIPSRNNALFLLWRYGSDLPR